MPPRVESWDYLVLTAPGEVQARAFERQLRLRRELGLLIDVAQVRVIPDPHGKRVGSGGSTIGCLRQILSEELERLPAAQRTDRAAWIDVLQRVRILIMHAGGDARRLSAYSPFGKSFLPLPLPPDGALGPTLFDSMLATYLQMEPPTDAGQLVVTSGDVFLDFDPAAVRFAPTGVTGLACLDTPETGRGHGVFVADDAGRALRVLQKPSVEEQSARGAVNASGKVLLDVGVIRFDAPSMRALLELAGAVPSGAGTPDQQRVAAEIAAYGLDLYRDLCCALGHESSFEEYLQTVRGAGARWSEPALRVLYQQISQIPLHVQPLPDARFLHFGTALQLISSGQELVAARGGQVSDGRLVINSHIATAGLLSGSQAWIEGCLVEAPLQLAGQNVVVGVNVRSPLALPDRACIDIIPGRDPRQSEIGVVRCLYADDNFAAQKLEAATLGGHSLPTWLQEVGAVPGDVWEASIPPEAQTLWNARLFPACSLPVEMNDWLWMLEPKSATRAQIDAWRAASRYSMAEIASLADHELFLERRLALGAARLAASPDELFRPESGFSADDLGVMLSRLEVPGVTCRQLLDEAHARTRAAWQIVTAPAAPPDGSSAADSHQASPASGASPAAMFASARILHSLGSAIERMALENGGTGARPLAGLLKGLTVNEPPAMLVPADAADSPPATTVTPEPDAGSPSSAPSVPSLNLEMPAAEAAALLRNAAFDLIRSIITSGTGGNRPRNAGVPVCIASSRRPMVRGTAPVRMDLAGGWTDTPPYALENGGCVVNVAVDLNGRPPLEVTIRPLDKPLIRLVSADTGKSLEIDRLETLHASIQPDADFALVKAALVQVGFSTGAVSRTPATTLARMLQEQGSGLEIRTAAALPQGSGLGTSSIMGALVLAVLHRFLGRELTQQELFHSTLQLEQSLTTGGGWQDQVGGVAGGVKLVTAAPGLVPRLDVRLLAGSLFERPENRGQFLLYYTGISRLAKNILQKVVGRYLDRERLAMVTLRRLHQLPQDVAATLLQGDTQELGRQIAQAWQLNKTLDPSSTNPEVEALFARIDPFVRGAKLLGAGGGGFVLMVCKSVDDASRVRELLTHAPPNPQARFYDFDVNPHGLEIRSEASSEC